MNDSADEPPLPQPLHTWARTTEATNLNFSSPEAGPSHPDLNPHTTLSHHVYDHILGSAHTAASEEKPQGQDTEQKDRAFVDKKGEGEKPATMTDDEAKAPLGQRFLRDCKRIIFCSWINVLLIFVPIGIVLGAIVKAKGDASHISPSVVFGVNCVAIIPLASLLSFATESVASKMGDTIGALLNVTFGNAVELIIFIIALVAGEIRIVQASLLGSILSNLLLILGMCFVFGGLRFREQLYNPRVSQMSACLLSLSVISLLLPTAFHASFNNTTTADRVVIKVSRGTSVVLLLVYVLYLLFQLKSHAYMYESTPQHLIDEESHPGVLANMLDSGSSSSDSSSDDDSDTDSSSNSYTTANRIRRVLRRKHRKSESSSKGTSSPPSFTRTNSSNTNNTNNNSIISSAKQPTLPPELSPSVSQHFDTVLSGDEGDVDANPVRIRGNSQNTGFTARDFEVMTSDDHNEKRSKRRFKGKSKKSKRSKNSKKKLDKEDEKAGLRQDEAQVPAQVSFASEMQEIPDFRSSTRPFNMRHLSSMRTNLPKGLSSNVFTHHQATIHPLPVQGIRPLSAPSATSGPIRRTASLPEFSPQNPLESKALPISVQPLPHLMPVNQPQALIDPKDIVDGKKHLSKTSSVILLLFTTGLVAVCAEFLVDSINYLVSTSGVSQAFVGLIILPIVGNAAEHVTAVTVASKNKMDLAINVALGSSIQIALFVTPIIVLLGWILNSEMSLYFSLFETISLFASAFIVNYLMIDGRSNYLEGALLIAAYVIIAVAAFFYPSCDLSSASGPGGSQVC